MIREATEQDIPAILDIWNTVIRDTVITFNPVEKSPADLAQLLAEKAAASLAFLVAADDLDVLGFATYGQFRNGRGYQHTVEHSILLAPAARGRGIGRALMTGIENHARTGGAHSIFAGVSAGNPPGIAFHTSMGFTTVATLPQVGRKFGQWWDLVLMQKFLS
jgi:L-amino acid N-acyltransferase